LKNYLGNHRFSLSLKKTTIAGEVIIRGAWLRVVFAHFINENTDYSNGLIVAVLFS
jgi:hypothetical protein